MSMPEVIQFLRSVVPGEHFSSRSQGFLLWGGLAVLTLTLLILSRTRWGQVRPLSKCVALSVFAHVLLLGYAYGTRLIFDYPAPAHSPAIQLSIIEGEMPQRGESDDWEDRPWDQLAFAPTPTPTEAALEREALDVELPAQTRVVEAPRFGEQPPAVEPLDFIEPERSLPLESAAPDVRITTAAPQTAAAEPPRTESTEPRAEPAPVVPKEVASPPRIAAEVVSSPSEFAAVEPERLFDERSELERLAEVDLPLPRMDDRAAAIAASPFDQTDVDARVIGIRRKPDAELPADDANWLTAGARTIPVSIQSRRRLGDGEVVPELYGLRVPERRLQVAEQFGGTAQTEQAVEAALDWLAAAQQPDGRWDASRFGAGRETHELGHDRQGAGGDADTAITGLTLLALLGAGHTHLEGDHRDAVRGGLEFLLRSQGSDGNLCGSARLFARMYCHGIATLALSEAYVMTGDRRLEPYLKNAVRYSIESQHPTSGGWRYQPGDRGDMSQFGWQVMALRSAELAGIPIPDASRAAMLRFIESVATGTHGGKASYRPGDRPSRTMTAESLACRLFLDAPLDGAGFDEAAQFLMEEPPRDGRANFYYWYYATLALYQAQQGDPDGNRTRDWTAWNVALQQQLLRRQRNDGDMAGSWDSNTVWGGYGGRVYSTAMATLCLEVYYRYLPLYAVDEQP